MSKTASYYMLTRVSTKGQIVLPRQLRETDKITTGQEFEIERLDSGQYLLTRKASSPNEGMIDWLLNCPEKDWLEDSDRTETTADFKTPSFE